MCVTENNIVHCPALNYSDDDIDDNNNNDHDDYD